VARGTAATVSPELETDLHAQAGEAFAARGLAPYGTSNWSPRAECRHNLSYWLRRDYLSLGPSAHGLWRGLRYANAYALADWASQLESGADPAVSLERETAESRADERVMLALRLATGLDPADHPPEAMAEVQARYGEAFAAAVSQRRLEQHGLAWYVPGPHRFVADDIIAWLAAARAVRRRECAA
jgi:oxygen-independent coproporphyrinogen-3 oxidase